MKLTARLFSVLVLAFLIASIVLFQGCGSDVADKQGCPSGSYLANATDTITGPGDATFTGASSYNGPFPGGSVPYTPITFIITADNIPRNNVCLIVYTDGFWYTNSLYQNGTAITGVGPMNTRAVVTNDTGVAILYWSTEILPAANLVTTVTGSSTTYTAGADQKGTSWIQAYSGALGWTYNVNWTVNGEPGPN